MPVRMTCSSCNTRCLVPDDKIGKSLRCPKCKKTLVHPSLPPSPAENGPAAARTKPTGSNVGLIAAVLGGFAVLGLLFVSVVGVAGYFVYSRYTKGAAELAKVREEGIQIRIEPNTPIHVTPKKDPGPVSKTAPVTPAEPVVVKPPVPPAEPVVVKPAEPAPPTEPVAVKPAEPAPTELPRPANPDVEVRKLTGHFGSIIGLALSPDGTMLASAGGDGTVRLWDPVAGKLIRILKGQKQAVMTIAFSPDGKLLASGGYDPKVRIWDVAAGTELQTIEPKQGYVNSVAFSTDRKTLATTGQTANSILFWDLATGQVTRTYTDRAVSVKNLAYSADGSKLLSMTPMFPSVWDVASGKATLLVQNSTFSNHSAMSADGKTVVASQTDNRLAVWDVNSQKVLRLFQVKEYVQTLKLSSDPRIVATATGKTSLVRLWDVNSGTMLREMNVNSMAISMLFIQDGKYLVTGGNDGIIRIWYGVGAGELAIKPIEPTAPPGDVAVKPADPKPMDGDVIVVTGEQYAKEFVDDQAAFKAKYVGKTVELTGSVVTRMKGPAVDALFLFGVPGRFAVRCNAIPAFDPLHSGEKIKVRAKVQENGFLAECVLLEPRPGQAVAPVGDGIIAVTAEQLCKDYPDNAAYNKKYGNRMVEIEGEVDSPPNPARFGEENKYLILKGFEKRKVWCENAESFKDLKPGQKVKVKGKALINDNLWMVPRLTNGSLVGPDPKAAPPAPKMAEAPQPPGPEVIKVTAAQLAKDYVNPAAYNAKYANKMLEITGVVEHGVDPKSFLDEGKILRLRGFGKRSIIGDGNPAFEKVKRGQRITIRGKAKTNEIFSTFPMLTECTLLE